MRRLYGGADQMQKLHEQLSKQNRAYGKNKGKSNYNFCFFEEYTEKKFSESKKRVSNHNNY